MIILLFLNLGMAQIPQLAIQKLPEKVSVNEILKVYPISNHHFNLKAPQKCGEGEMVKKETMEIQCQFKKAGEYKLLFNVCDDKESYCKPERINLKVISTQGLKSQNLRTDMVDSPRTTAVQFSKGEISSPKGFLLNHPAAALSQAKAQNKLLLIDFSAHWCPYCNMYDEYVFGEKAFQDKTKEFVKIKLDADSDISWEWKEKFKVGGYPTIVIANTQLEEIGRIVGYRNLQVTTQLMEKFYKLKDESINQAEKKLNQPSEERTLRVAEAYFQRSEYDKVLELLKNTSSVTANRLKLITQSKLATKSNQKIELESAYDQLLQKFPDDIEYSSWVNEMAQLNPEKAKSLIGKMDLNIQSWVKNEKINYEDYSEADLRQIQAEVYETLGMPEKSKEFYAKCASYYEPLAKKSNLDLARGVNLERAYCLLKSGQTEKAKALYDSMVKTYGGEFAFNFNYARALMDLNETQQAYTYANNAFKNAYGDNLLRAATLKAKLELKMNKKQDAEKTVSETLTKFVLPESTQIRSHRYYGQLKDVLKEVQK